MLNRKEEAELIARARKGEVEAFMNLIKDYQRPIFSLIYRLTGNREDAADLTQETFLKAFSGLKDFREKSGFYTWLHRIAVNQTLNFLKKSSTRREKLEYLDEIKQDDPGVAAVPSPEESSIREEFRSRLQATLEELPMVYKLPFFLVIFQGMSHAEAAKVLGCSEGTVSWKIHEARKMIREKLKHFVPVKKEV
ncbi:MAG: sigma-70 family RNA polymerase sigma factor [Candidatus Saccharicenans sp.]|nr:sigma-70 family RNA polymerase sigma factor [Candidatus Saccharicenans sp.]